jgi:hypothetical protein
VAPRSKSRRTSYPALTEARLGSPATAVGPSSFFRPFTSLHPPILDTVVRRTAWRILVVVVLGTLSVSSLALTGCGGSRERGKNSDLDRPTTQKK